MSYNDNHTDFFKKVEVPYKKDKDELWDILSEKLKDTSKKEQTKVIKLSPAKLIAAAAITILIGTSFFLRFYEKTVVCPNAQHLSHVLPDGSIIKLNAASEVVYKPFWWKFKREVKFEGEAFFSIEHGERFAIVSKNGTTEILGTSFNIFSRNNNYKVYCKTGLVKVSSQKSEVELLVYPGEMAVINNRLKTSEVKHAAAEKVLAWQNSKFNFTSVRLIDVIEELERQYDVKIALHVKNPEQYLYTGYFTKAKSVDTSLKLICKSFGLSYKKDKKGKYIISE